MLASRCLLIRMNQLDSRRRAQIIRCVCERYSIWATARLCDCAINTFGKISLEVGAACADFHRDNVVGLSSRVVQADEMWSFVGCKHKRVTPEKR